MKKVFDSKYDEIFVEAETRIVKNRWKEATKSMNWEEFKTELLDLKKIVVENQTKGILGNTLNLYYTIVPEQQTWIAQNYFPDVLAAGLKKYAIIVSVDLITELSVEQTIDENANLPFESKYFKSEEEAYAWLIK